MVLLPTTCCMLTLVSSESSMGIPNFEGYQKYLCLPWLILRENTVFNRPNMDITPSKKRRKTHPWDQQIYEKISLIHSDGIILNHQKSSSMSSVFNIINHHFFTIKLVGGLNHLKHTTYWQISGDHHPSRIHNKTCCRPCVPTRCV